MSIISDRAAKIMKIIALARTPGMDRIAVALNAEATYDEKQAAREWEAALEYAATDKPISITALSKEWKRRAAA